MAADDFLLVAVELRLQIDCIMFLCDSRSVSMRRILASRCDRLSMNGSTLGGWLLRARREVG